METPVFNSFADIPVKEIARGFHSRLIHTATNTINFIEVAAGCSVPPHRHLHEQYTFVLEGRFELTVDGRMQVLDAGRYALIPSNIEHSGIAVTDCRLLDIFSPVREDYRQL